MNFPKIADPTLLEPDTFYLFQSVLDPNGPMFSFSTVYNNWVASKLSIPEFSTIQPSVFVDEDGKRFEKRRFGDFVMLVPEENVQTTTPKEEDVDAKFEQWKQGNAPPSVAFVGLIADETDDATFQQLMRRLASEMRAGADPENYGGNEQLFDNAIRELFRSYLTRGVARAKIIVANTSLMNPLDSAEEVAEGAVDVVKHGWIGEILESWAANSRDAFEQFVKDNIRLFLNQHATQTRATVMKQVLTEIERIVATKPQYSHLKEAIAANRQIANDILDLPDVSNLPAKSLKKQMYEYVYLPRKGGNAYVYKDDSYRFDIERTIRDPIDLDTFTHVGTYTDAASGSIYDRYEKEYTHEQTTKKGKTKSEQRILVVFTNLQSPQQVHQKRLEYIGLGPNPTKIQLANKLACDEIRLAVGTYQKNVPDEFFAGDCEPKRVAVVNLATPETLMNAIAVAGGIPPMPQSPVEQKKIAPKPAASGAPSNIPQQPAPGQCRNPATDPQTALTIVPEATQNMLKQQQNAMIIEISEYFRGLLYSLRYYTGLDGYKAMQADANILTGRSALGAKFQEARRTTINLNVLEGMKKGNLFALVENAMHDPNSATFNETALSKFLVQAQTDPTLKMGRSTAGRQIDNEIAAHQRGKPNLVHFVFLNTFCLLNARNLTVPLAVYRGQPSYFAPDDPAPLLSLQPGKTIKFQSLISTSFAPHVSQGFIDKQAFAKKFDPSDVCNLCCLIKFELPANYPGILLEQYTEFPGEQELLLPAFVLRNPKAWQQKGDQTLFDMYRTIVARFLEVTEPAEFVCTSITVQSFSTARGAHRDRVYTVRPTNGF